MIDETAVNAVVDDSGMVIGFWPLPVRGDLDEPECVMCHQTIGLADQLYAALMVNGEIIAPLCASCANTE